MEDTLKVVGGKKSKEKTGDVYHILDVFDAYPNQGLNKKFGRKTKVYALIMLKVKIR